MKIDFPLPEVIETCERVIRDGAFIQQVWTCAGCKQRISAGNLNLLTHAGHCQHCNTVTDLDKTGCNYRLFVPGRPTTLAEMEHALGLSPARKEDLQ